MRRVREFFAKAFHVEPPGPAEPSEIERPIIDRLCREVVRRRMTTPALLALECSRPMNYLGSQAMHFFQPMASVLVNPAQWDAFAAFLEKRGSIEYLARRLEDLEAEMESTGTVASPPPSEAAPRSSASSDSGADRRGPSSDPIDPGRLLDDRNQL